MSDKAGANAGPVPRRITQFLTPGIETKMNALTVVTEPAIALPATLRVALQGAADLAASSSAPSTRAAYASDFRIFEKWCANQGLTALPADPAAVAGFIADQAAAGMKPSTLGRRMAAIKYRHKTINEPSPTDDERCKAVMRGARRTLGVAPRKLAAATAEKVIGMQTLTRRGIIGKRDKALLLLGFSLAARRSELVALDFSDIEECPEGLRIKIRKSKTDQEGQGATIAVCRGQIACPVKALKEWMTAANITEGPVFLQVRKGGHVTDRRLSGEAVRRIVKMHAAKLGLDPANFGAHSLRAGFLTSAAARGASVFKMMDISRHKSVDTLRGYIREADAFKDNAGANLL
jgi:site-specific recombinase XerD